MCSLCTLQKAELTLKWTYVQSTHTNTRTALAQLHLFISWHSHAKRPCHAPNLWAPTSIISLMTHLTTHVTRQIQIQHNCTLDMFKQRTSGWTFFLSHEAEDFCIHREAKVTQDNSDSKFECSACGTRHNYGDVSRRQAKDRGGTETEEEVAKLKTGAGWMNYMFRNYVFKCLVTDTKKEKKKVLLCHTKKKHCIAKLCPPTIKIQDI